MLYYEIRRRIRQKLRFIYTSSKPITYAHGVKIKIFIAGILFCSCWHFLGTKAAQSAFLEKDILTGEERWLDPRDVKRNVKESMKKRHLFTKSENDYVMQRKPVEITKIQFNLDTE